MSNFDLDDNASICSAGDLQTRRRLSNVTASVEGEGLSYGKRSWSQNDLSKGDRLENTEDEETPRLTQVVDAGTGVFEGDDTFGEGDILGYENGAQDEDEYTSLLVGELKKRREARIIQQRLNQEAEMLSGSLETGKAEEAEKAEKDASTHEQRECLYPNSAAHAHCKRRKSDASTKSVKQISRADTPASRVETPDDGRYHPNTPVEDHEHFIFDGLFEWSVYSRKHFLKVL